jgi:hypothetical protein
VNNVSKPPAAGPRGLIAFLMAVGLVLAAAGCGGGSRDTRPAADARGAAEFTIRWPEPGGRLVPATTASIRITLTRDGQTLAEQVVARPPTGQNTSTVRLQGLTPGAVVATAVAYPRADGTGTPLASGTIGLTIVADRSTPATLTMNSTIAAVTLSPATPSLRQGKTLALTATALDANGAVVLTDPINWSWSSSEPPIATVVPSGNPTTVTGVEVGTSTLTATERESGQSTAVAVTVTEPITVSVSPVAATAPVGEEVEIQFTATVRGTTNTGVTWSIRAPADPERNPPAGGTITPEGSTYRRQRDRVWTASTSSWRPAWKTRPRPARPSLRCLRNTIPVDGRHP